MSGPRERRVRTALGLLGCIVVSCAEPAIPVPEPAEPARVAPRESTPPEAPAEVGPAVPEHLRSAPELTAAYETLLRASTYESAHIGYAGELSDNARALRLLLSAPQAAATMEALWQEGTPVSQLYVTAATWYLAPDRFAERLAALEELEGEIDARSGCIGWRAPMHEMMGSRCRDRHPPGLGTSSADDACRRRRRREDSFCATVSNGRDAMELVEPGPRNPDECRLPSGERTHLALAEDGSLCVTGPGTAPPYRRCAP